MDKELNEQMCDIPSEPTIVLEGYNEWIYEFEKCSRGGELYSDFDYDSDESQYNEADSAQGIPIPAELTEVRKTTDLPPAFKKTANVNVRPTYGGNITSYCKYAGTCGEIQSDYLPSLLKDSELICPEYEISKSVVEMLLGQSNDIFDLKEHSTSFRFSLTFSAGIIRLTNISTPTLTGILTWFAEVGTMLITSRRFLLDKEPASCHNNYDVVIDTERMGLKELLSTIDKDLLLVDNVLLNAHYIQAEQSDEMVVGRALSKKEIVGIISDTSLKPYLRNCSDSDTFRKDSIISAEVNEVQVSAVSIMEIYKMMHKWDSLIRSMCAWVQTATSLEAIHGSQFSEPANKKSPTQPGNSPLQSQSKVNATVGEVSSGRLESLSVAAHTNFLLREMDAVITNAALASYSFADLCSRYSAGNNKQDAPALYSAVTEEDARLRHSSGEAKEKEIIPYSDELPSKESNKAMRAVGSEGIPQFLPSKLSEMMFSLDDDSTYWQRSQQLSYRPDEKLLRYRVQLARLLNGNLNLNGNEACGAHTQNSAASAASSISSTTNRYLRSHKCSIKSGDLSLSLPLQSSSNCLFAAFMGNIYGDLMQAYLGGKFERLSAKRPGRGPITVDRTSMRDNYRISPLHHSKLSSDSAALPEVEGFIPCLRVIVEAAHSSRKDLTILQNCMHTGGSDSKKALLASAEDLRLIEATARATAGYRALSSAALLWPLHDAADLAAARAERPWEAQRSSGRIRPLTPLDPGLYLQLGETLGLVQGEQQYESHVGKLQPRKDIGRKISESRSRYTALDSNSSHGGSGDGGDGVYMEGTGLTIQRKRWGEGCLLPADAWKQKRISSLRTAAEIASAAQLKLRKAILWPSSTSHPFREAGGESIDDGRDGERVHSEEDTNRLNSFDEMKSGRMAGAGGDVVCSAGCVRMPYGRHFSLVPMVMEALVQHVERGERDGAMNRTGTGGGGSATADSTAEMLSTADSTAEMLSTRTEAMGAVGSKSKSKSKKLLCATLDSSERSLLDGASILPASQRLTIAVTRPLLRSLFRVRATAADYICTKLQLQQHWKFLQDVCLLRVPDVFVPLRAALFNNESPEEEIHVWGRKMRALNGARFVSRSTRSSTSDSFVADAAKARVRAFESFVWGLGESTRTHILSVWPGAEEGERDTRPMMMGGCWDTAGNDAYAFQSPSTRRTSVGIIFSSNFATVKSSFARPPLKSSSDYFSQPQSVEASSVGSSDTSAISAPSLLSIAATAELELRYPWPLSDVLTSATISKCNTAMRFLLQVRVVRWAAEAVWKENMRCAIFASQAFLSSPSPSPSSSASKHQQVLSSSVSSSSAAVGASRRRQSCDPLTATSHSSRQRKHTITNLSPEEEIDLQECTRSRSRCEAGLSLVLHTVSALQSYYLTTVHGRIHQHFDDSIRNVEQQLCTSSTLSGRANAQPIVISFAQEARAAALEIDSPDLNSVDGLRIAHLSMLDATIASLKHQEHNVLAVLQQGFSAAALLREALIFCQSLRNPAAQPTSHSHSRSSSFRGRLRDDRKGRGLNATASVGELELDNQLLSGVMIREAEKRFRAAEVAFSNFHGATRELIRELDRVQKSSDAGCVLVSPSSSTTAHTHPGGSDGFRTVIGEKAEPDKEGGTAPGARWVGDSGVYDHLRQQSGAEGLRAALEGIIPLVED